MLLKIDMTSKTPIYVQLRNEIVMGIGKGEIKIGESLPTVRQLSQDLGVNTMTVNKTYSILKEEGFIEIDRRHGAKISPKSNKNNDYTNKIESELLLLLTQVNLKGYNKVEILEICKNIIENLNINEIEVKV